MVIRPLESEDTVLASLIATLNAARQDTAQWEHAIWPGGHRLDQIIESRYGYDSSWPVTRAVLVSIAAITNGIQIDEHNTPTGTLVLPPLPRLPSSAAKQGALTQFFSPTGYAVVLAEAKAVEDSAPRMPVLSGDLTSGLTWSVYGTETELRNLAFNRRFLITRVLSTRRARYTQYAALPGRTDPSRDSTISVSPFIAPQVRFTKLKVTSPLTFSLFDFFTPHDTVTCPHGWKVRDILYATFDSLLDVSQAKQVAPNRRLVSLRTRELYFRDSLDTAVSIMERFADDMVLRNGIDILEKVARLKTDSSIAREDVVPEYLRSLYWESLQDPGTKVISMSYAFPEQLINLIPSEERKSRADVVVLNAVLNDPVGMEDMPHYEPLSTLSGIAAVTTQASMGALLVGGVTDEGILFGMFNRTDNDVRVLGRARGWQYSGGCINPSESGNSFATPQVGALLAVTMQAYATRGDSPISGQELARRALLSSRVDSRYLRRIASAGIPQVALMVRGRGTYFIRSTGEVDTASINVNSSSIALELPGDTPVYRLGAREKHGEISAFYLSGNQVFYYSEATGAWEAATYQDFQLHLVNGDVLDARAFLERYVGMVAF